MIFYRSSVVDAIGPRNFFATAATPGLKGDGYNLDMGGCDLSRARDGRMALLYNHDVGQIVGKVASARVMPDKIVVEGEFAPPGISARIDEVCGLVKAGILNGISVGFDALETTPRDPKRPRAGRIVTKWVLLETSLTPVPLDSASGITARARARFGDYDFDDARADADRRRRQAEMLALVHPVYGSADWQKRQRALEVLERSAAIVGR